MYYYHHIQENTALKKSLFELSTKLSSSKNMTFTIDLDDNVNTPEHIIDDYDADTDEFMYAQKYDLKVPVFGGMIIRVCVGSYRSCICIKILELWQVYCICII
jgi:hypothetical protein